MALQNCSLAIDAGDNTTCADTTTVNNKDQRGVTRPIDGDANGTATCDIGAYEYDQRVISGNAGISGVTVNYTGGSATADGSGNYSFYVTIGWSGTATPSALGYTFVPDHRTYASVTLDQTGQDYVATFTIPPPIIQIAPTAGAQACQLPQIQVNFLLSDLMRTGGSFDPTTVTLKLDGTDVTSSASAYETETAPASEAGLTYTPPSSLALGSHQVQFVFPTSGGPQTLTWNFTAASIACPTGGGAHGPVQAGGSDPNAGTTQGP